MISARFCFHRVAEVTEQGSGSEVLSGMGIRLHTTNTKFSGAMDKGCITLQGSVRNGDPFLTKIGTFDVEVALQVCSGAPFCHVPCCLA